MCVLSGRSSVSRSEDFIACLEPVRDVLSEKERIRGNLLSRHTSPCALIGPRLTGRCRGNEWSSEKTLLVIISGLSAAGWICVLQRSRLPDAPCYLPVSWRTKTSVCFQTGRFQGRNVMWSSPDQRLCSSSSGTSGVTRCR